MLDIQDVECRYGRVTVLYSVTLSVREGEVVSLVGPNGAGKSTLLRAVSGLIRISSGAIRFLGHRIDSLEPHAIVRSGVSHVPEGRRLFPLMTVRENLELGAYLCKNRVERASRVDFVFGLFPILKERHKQLAGTLSGGEQQMLTIARSLMSRPRLVMLDEPSLGLAPHLVHQTFATIAEIAAAGTTVLLVEQNVQQSLAVADRGYVIENGRIVLAGTGKKLLASDHVREAYLGL